MQYFELPASMLSTYQSLETPGERFRRRAKSIAPIAASFFLFFLIGATFRAVRNKSTIDPSNLSQLSLIETNSSSSNNNHHFHDIPTLLSIKDPTTDEHINALENPLYDYLAECEFVSSEDVFLRKTMPDVRETPEPNDPILWVDPPEISIRDTLTISFQNTALNDNDVITLHCPSNDHHSTIREAFTIHQAKYMASPDSPQNNDTVFRWTIPHFPTIRHDTCEFRLWNNNHRHPSSNNNKRLHLHSTSGPFRIRDSQNTPTGIHLALTGKFDRLTVHFATGWDGIPIVEYSKDATEWRRIEGTSDTYAAKDMCESPADEESVGKFSDPGMLHTVTLLDLVPDTKYFYRVGLIPNDSSSIITTWSPIHTLISPPSPTSTLKFLAYGDQGCPSTGWDGGYHQMTKLAQTYLHNSTDPIRSIHHIGDLSYAMGAAHIWDAWLDMIQPLVTSVPLMIAIGNHEYDHFGGGEGKDLSGVEDDGGYHPIWGNMRNDSGGECGVPVVKRFRMPESDGGGNGVFWYEYDYGMMHVIVLSSEHDLNKGSRQHTWFETALRRVDREATPWLIVECHRPLYNAEQVWEQNAVGVRMREEIEDLLFVFKVDVFLAGHYHSYLRTCRGLYRGECDVGGTLHVTVGTAGASLDVEDQLYEQDWTEVYWNVWGYGRAEVNRTAFVWEFVGDDEEHEVLDRVVLTKD